MTPLGVCHASGCGGPLRVCKVLWGVTSPRVQGDICVWDPSGCGQSFGGVGELLGLGMAPGQSRH